MDEMNFGTAPQAEANAPKEKQPPKYREFCSTACFKSSLPIRSPNILRMALSVSPRIFGRKSPAYSLCK